MKYLVVKCDELGDQFECDADRTPICLTDNYSEYDKNGYEIYEVNSDGTFTLIREYDKITNYVICVCNWGDINKPIKYEEVPYSISKIMEGDRKDVKKGMVEQVKKHYGFTESIKEILSDIKCCGAHGEEINGEWVVFGIACDDWYPIGY